VSEGLAFFCDKICEILTEKSGTADSAIALESEVNELKKSEMMKRVFMNPEHSALDKLDQFQMRATRAPG
jgi:hypothetical protein